MKTFSRKSPGSICLLLIRLLRSRAQLLHYDIDARTRPAPDQAPCLPPLRRSSMCDDLHLNCSHADRSIVYRTPPTPTLKSLSTILGSCRLRETQLHSVRNTLQKRSARDETRCSPFPTTPGRKLILIVHPSRESPPELHRQSQATIGLR